MEMLGKRKKRERERDWKKVWKCSAVRTNQWKGSERERMCVCVWEREKERERGDTEVGFSITSIVVTTLIEIHLLWNNFSFYLTPWIKTFFSPSSDGRFADSWASISLNFQSLEIVSRGERQTHQHARPNFFSCSLSIKKWFRCDLSSCVELDSCAGTWHMVVVEWLAKLPLLTTNNFYRGSAIQMCFFICLYLALALLTQMPLQGSKPLDASGINPGLTASQASPISIRLQPLGPLGSKMFVSNYKIK